MMGILAGKWNIDDAIHQIFPEKLKIVFGYLHQH